MDLNSLIRDIPDFPEKGIVFKDITTLLSDNKAFSYAINIFKERYENLKIDKIIGIEARGFILGSSLALTLNCGFIPIRKKGKLPYNTFTKTYDLEYGSDTLEIHTDAISHSDNVILIDDVLATGGTIEASIDLLNNFNTNIVECAFLIELLKLNGKNKIISNHLNYFSLLKV